MMSTKHFASNSVLRRASQFESGSALADQSSNRGGSTSQNENQSTVSIKRPSLRKSPKTKVDDEDHQKTMTIRATSNEQQHQQQNVFISSAYARFKSEYARLYPDSPAPPFSEPANAEEAADALRRQQARASELSLELSKAKFAVNFLKGITNSSSSSSGNADRKDSTTTATTATDKGSLNNSGSGGHFDDESSGATSTTTTNGSCTAEASLSNSSSTTNEQYVTVITLNDSTYGEIQRQQPKTTKTTVVQQQQPSEDPEEVVTMESISTTVAETKAEPIYLNTLESQKSDKGEKVSKKRPPTPPRKPQFSKGSTSIQNKQGSSNDILAAVSASSSTTTSSSPSAGANISKSESLKSMSRLQRKFNGPLQQIEVAKSTTAINHQHQQTNQSKLAGKSAPPPPPLFMRTFSQPEPTLSQKATTNASESSKTKDGEESVGDIHDNEDEVRNTEDDEEGDEDDELNYRDNYDNIYDTVAPDQEEEEEEDSEGDLLARDDQHSQENLRREDREDEMTSSHEMLSRSSSTDEGLNSNYVNIDYFLRKSSLGRSSSNIPGSMGVPSSGASQPRNFRGNGRKKSSLGLGDTEAEDTADDAETNLSSMKSSDYDNSFSSNENLIEHGLPPYQQRGYQQQQQQQSMVNSNSLRSFNSSTLSSTGSAGGTPSGSLRTRSLKMNSNSGGDLASASYPPNMSTFTPPIRDRGQFTFFNKEGDHHHHHQQQQNQQVEETTTTDLGAADLPISPIPPPSKAFVAAKSSKFGQGSRKASSSSKSNSTGSVEYYAYTDILDSLPNKEPKVSAGSELADESLVMENKPLGGHGSDVPESPESKQASSSPQNQSCQALSRSEVEQCRTMQWKIIRSIIESETVYLDCLNTLQQYMKALSTTTNSSSKSSSDKDTLLSPEDLRTIFYRIPDLYQVHSAFLGGLKAVEHGYKMKLHSVMAGESKVATKLMTKNSVGELFFRLASNLPIYADFLRNYSKALETAGRCCAQSSKFSEIIKSIKVASLNGSNQTTNLVDLLHKPVARLQKNALVLHDLLKFVDSRNEEEQNLLKEALKMTQTFLNELNLETSSTSSNNSNRTKSIFPATEKFQRRLVKESFIVEAAVGGGGGSGSSGDLGRRKLRHLFLFNDVIVCAKYKASTKQKFTFELKWFQMLGDVLLDPSLDSLQHSNSSSTLQLNRSLNSSSTSSNSSSSVGSPSSNAAAAAAAAKDQKEAANSLATVESLKSRAFAARYEVFVEEKKSSGGKASEKHRKKLSELESELVLWLPQLKFSLALKGSNASKVQHLFYLSSEYERGWWVDTIRHLQTVLAKSAHDEHVSPHELQRHIEECRKSMSPNLGSFLLRTNKDESLRFGDLHLRFIHLNGYVASGRQNLYFVVETDSYGHYFKQAVTRFVTDDDRENINEDFLLELEGTQSLRILAYETPKRILGGGGGGDSHHHHHQQHSQPSPPAIFKGKATFDLTTSSNLLPDYAPKELSILEYSLSISLSFTSWKSMMERTPPNRICGTFGLPIATVCKKERSKVPLLITCCINEVQRRGLREVGVYRVSGLSSDVAKLRKAFETNPRDACWLIGHVDIHTVTGLLKSYLRELPESLFTNDMYQRYIEARGIDLKNAEERERRMTTLLSKLPEPNKSTICCLIDHLVQVNCHEEENKMSLNNLATVFGPTMLKTNSSDGGGKGSKGASNSNANSGGNSSAGVGSSISGDNPFAINTDLFTASTIDVMAQADIVYFYLRRKSEGLSLTSFDREETSL